MKALARYGLIWAVVWMAAGALARADSRIALTVRVYNASHVPAPELQAARRAFELAYRDSGLDMTFRYCGSRVPPTDGVDLCADALTSRTVVVRVIDAPAFSATLHPDAYGMAYIVKETDRGWLATVFSDRIGGAATRVGVEPGTLLGLVMAHEVAHLLLGLDYHGDTGVMRANWPDALLHRRGEPWQFSTIEAAKMRDAASMRF